MRLLAAIGQDMRFQFRHGFYYAYAVLTILYIVILRLLPEAYRFPALTVILFADICALGFFFVGAIVLLEKGQNIAQSLFVTPLRLSEYLLAKQISFLILSVSSAAAIMLGATIWGKDMIWFAMGVILSASVYTLFGLVFATRARHVNDYFVKALGIGLIISSPILTYAGLFDTQLFYLLPTRATLILLDVLANDYSTGEKVYAFSSLFIWLAITSIWAWVRFEKYVRHSA